MGDRVDVPIEYSNTLFCLIVINYTKSSMTRFTDVNEQEVISQSEDLHRNSIYSFL